MSCKYRYKGKDYTAEGLIQVLSIDSDVISKYKAQEERITSDDFAPEDIDVFNQKVAFLKKSMNVEVIMDDSVKTSRVLGRGDARVKEAGKPVILINPNSIFKTTAIHEFGHIFIDAFPKGLNNPRIQRALKQLEGTELERQVKEGYPDLTPDMLQKEILVTAIGQKGSQIWEDGLNRSKWETFMAWLSDFLKRTFGLERNEVESLSRELLSNKVKQLSTTQLEERSQQIIKLRVKKEAKKLTEEEKAMETITNKVERIHSKVLSRTKKLLAKQQDQQKSKEARAREERNIKKGKPTRLSSITEIQESLNRFEDADKMLGVIKYTEWAHKELNFMKSEIKRRINENKITDNNLRKSFDWSASFSVVDDIKDMLTDVSDEDLSEFLTEEQIETLRNRVRELNSLRDDVHSQLMNLAKSVYARLLADNDTETEEGYKAAFKDDWKALNSAGGTDLQEGEYILQKMQEYHDEIEQVKLDKAKERSEEAVGRLSLVGMGILSETQMRSKDIKLVSRLISEASGKIERFSTEEATEFQAMHDEFIKSGASNISNRDMRKKYKGMYVFSESGQGYFTGEYKPEFIEKKNEMIANTFEEEKRNELYGDIDIKIEKGQKKDQTGDLIDFTKLKYKSKVPSGKTGKEIERTLAFKGAKDITLEGQDSLEPGERATHVLYTNSAGKEVRITLNEAIARSELKAWIDSNTKTTYEMVYGKKEKHVTPIDKWKSKEWEELKKDPVRFKELQKLLNKVKEGNEDYDSRDSLIQKEGTVDFVRLPGVMKTTASRVAQMQGVKTLGKHIISTLVQTQQDEFDTETVQAYTDFSEGETLRIPISYRAKLNESDQSLDLHSMVFMDRIMAKNYKEKKAIESSLKVVQEVLKEKRYPEIDPITGKQKIDAQSGYPLWVTVKGGSNIMEYNKVESIVQNRLYGITTKQAGGFQYTTKKGTEDEKTHVVEYQKAGQSLMKYFGSVSLVFNYMNSIVNTGTGTLSNLIDAIGGDTYNLSDYRKGSMDYNRDLKNIMNDFGKSVGTSRTNMLMNAWNVMGPDYLKKKFEKGGKVESMASQSTLRPLAKAGEHMMQGKVMYSILRSIRVQNEKGQWINKDGLVVKSKKEAASLGEMISFAKNKKTGRIEMKLDKRVQNTSFTTGGAEKIMLETRNLIRAKIDELHGQYTTDIQAHAQRYMLGKYGFFLRKWMIPGYIRRFRGVKNFYKASDTELSETEKFYNEDMKDDVEGYYVSAARFLSKIIKDAKEDQLSIVKSWKDLTPRQKAGVKKTLADLTLIAIVWTLSGMLEAGDDEDEWIHLRYLLRRQESELANFINPIEAFKIAQTPTAATGNLKQIFKLIYQIGDPFEKYQIGPYKGDFKMKHKAKKLLPRFKNPEDFKQALDFLNSMSM